MAHDNVVIVGVDGSEPSLAAADWALEQAKKRDASLHLVCAIQLPQYAVNALASIPAVSVEHLTNSANELLREVSDRMEGHGVSVKTSVEMGDPTEVLTTLSKKAALVVIGGRSTRNTFTDRLLRTASSAVPANAFCPTVVVPFVENRKFQPIKKIVVGVDGSEHARMALQRAVWEADRWDAKLECVMSVPASYTPGGPAIVVREEVLDEAKALIRSELDALPEKRDIDVDIISLEGNPAYTLPAFTRDSDLIVVGTRGRGGIRGLLLGSTSQMILGQSECPIMVVPRRVRDEDDAGTHGGAGAAAAGEGA